MSVLAGPAQAVESIVVLGLFKNKAIVKIDGKQRVLRQHKKSPEGVLLISADSDAAVLEIDGKRDTYTLGREISTHFSKPDLVSVNLYRNEIGMYTTVGSINGLPVKFLVDTGATYIAMNGFQARRLGIDYLLSGKPSIVSTASGVERAYDVTLDKVTVGDITLNHIQAVVLDGPSPQDVLLGMSFLGKLEMRNTGQILELKKKF